MAGMSNIDAKSEAAFMLIQAYKKLTDLPDMEIACRVADALELKFVGDLTGHYETGRTIFAHTETLQRKEWYLNDYL